MTSLVSNNAAPPPPQSVSIRRVFRRNGVVLIPRGMRPSTAIRLLVETLANTGQIAKESVESIVDELLECERHSPTAIGRGLAFPHLRTRDVLKLVGSIGLAPSGIDFSSRDFESTKLIFLFLSPWDNRDHHMNLLARLAGLMHVDRLASTLTNDSRPEEVYEFIVDLDARREPPAFAKQAAENAGLIWR